MASQATTIGNLARIAGLASKQYSISVEDVHELIALARGVFVDVLVDAGHDQRQILRITTKFRDAGRRSAPWRQTSSRVPGRPQDGADGNRINRWLLQPNHKFYADEVTATLVEVKYYLQALCMEDAPSLPDGCIRTRFSWMLEQPVEPGAYMDPLQLVPINLANFVRDPRAVESGHLVPLDIGGKHHPDNAFLMLARSNQLQGNQTVADLIKMMREIIRRHDLQQTKTLP